MGGVNETITKLQNVLNEIDAKGAIISIVASVVTFVTLSHMFVAIALSSINSGPTVFIMVVLGVPMVFFITGVVNGAVYNKNYLIPRISNI